MELIQLTQGFTAIVDADCLPMLLDHHWHVSKKNGRPVAQTSIKNPLTGKFRSVMMHRLLIDAPYGALVDHKNGNTLDNRLANLRLATPTQNSRNRSPACVSGYTGVRGAIGGWVAMISPDGLDINLGTHPTLEIAAAAYNAAAEMIYGEFAKPNPVAKVDGILDQIVSKKRASVARLLKEINILEGVVNAG